MKTMDMLKYEMCVGLNKDKLAKNYNIIFIVIVLRQDAIKDTGGHLS